MNVLLLHAGIADNRMWAPQVEALEAAGHRVFAPDLPGYGTAALEPGEVAYVEFAAAQLDGPAAVVGCSFGGRIALELALDRPDLVQRLVLVGAPPLPGAEWSEAAQGDFAEEEGLLEGGDLAGAAAQQARMWLAPDADPAVRALTEAMTLRSYELQLPLEDAVKATWPEPVTAERLAELAVPTLVVVGAADVDDIQATAGDLAAQIPGARLERIEGAGHLPGLERPEELNRLLLDVLR
ncbi:MAG: alpha/beta hydrolase [Actinobacteria bacterium]|nr:alpha/beta hydrolase [Actinomycetota bacterium]